MLYYERKFKRQGFTTLIGVDEAGRGPLAGPVVAAAVILSEEGFSCRIDDSKKLTDAQRRKAYKEIVAKCDYGIACVGHETIDEINILQATRLAMRRAIEELAAKAVLADRSLVHVLIDGNVPPDIPFAHSCIIKGDARSRSIACASILAKVSRDDIMNDYDRQFPGYGFSRHKGYPTALHRKVLRSLGPSFIHRRSFSCV